MRESETRLSTRHRDREQVDSRTCLLRPKIDTATLISIEKKATSQLLLLEYNTPERNHLSCERIPRATFE